MTEGTSETKLEISKQAVAQRKDEYILQADSTVYCCWVLTKGLAGNG